MNNEINSKVRVYVYNVDKSNHQIFNSMIKTLLIEDKDEVVMEQEIIKVEKLLNELYIDHLTQILCIQ